LGQIRRRRREQWLRARPEPPLPLLIMENPQGFTWRS